MYKYYQMSQKWPVMVTILKNAHSKLDKEGLSIEQDITGLNAQEQKINNLIRYSCLKLGASMLAGLGMIFVLGFIE